MKNAIMMIDFALDAQRSEGRPAREAIYQACLLRFRPILMTSLTTLVGLLPMALGIGTGSEANAPLARAVIGGLAVSTALTLLLIPALYMMLEERFPRRMEESESSAALQGETA